MIDQCKHCRIRGDYEECIKTKCFHHENWINKERIKRIRQYESQWIQAEMLLNAVGEALGGEEPSDFELSFPIVRKAWDLYNRKNSD